MPFAQVIQWGAMWIAYGGDHTVKLTLPHYIQDASDTAALGNIING